MTKREAIERCGALARELADGGQHAASCILTMTAVALCDPPPMIFLLAQWVHRWAIVYQGDELAAVEREMRERN